jgi:hypothetical protein
MNPAKLVLKKITITTLNDSDSDNLKGGISGHSVCQACIPPTEPEGCSNGCPSASYCCPRTIGAAQTQCCATWPPLCDSYVIACIG